MEGENNTFQRIATELVQVELADAKTGRVVDTLKGTPEHPFFVEGGGMVLGHRHERRDPRWSRPGGQDRQAGALP